MARNTTVIYNDTCPICSREVAGYRRLTDASGQGVDYVGLSTGRAADFGLDDINAAKRFHLVRDGKVMSGVAAFIALWRDIPRLAWLARFVSLPGVYQLARLGYDYAAAPLLFALHRRRQRHANAQAN